MGEWFLWRWPAPQGALCLQPRRAPALFGNAVSRGFGRFSHYRHPGDFRAGIRPVPARGRDPQRVASGPEIVGMTTPTFAETDTWAAVLGWGTHSIMSKLCLYAEPLWVSPYVFSSF